MNDREESIGTDTGNRFDIEERTGTDTGNGWYRRKDKDRYRGWMIEKKGQGRIQGIDLI